MGDRVAVMRKGELQQVAPPEELYDHPVNLFVGGFIGSPAMNVLEARLERQNGDLRVVTGDQALTLDSRTLEARPRLAEYEGREVILGIRPENLEDAALANGAPDDRRLHGKVELREGLGSEIVVHLAVRARPAVTEDVKELAEDLGAEPARGEAEEGDDHDRGAFRPALAGAGRRDGGGRRRHHEHALLRSRDAVSGSTTTNRRGRHDNHPSLCGDGGGDRGDPGRSERSRRLRTEGPPRGQDLGDGLDHLRGDRRRAGALQERPRGLREALSGHRHEVHVGGTEPDDHPLDGRRRRQSAGHGADPAAGLHARARQEEGPQADHVHDAARSSATGRRAGSHSGASAASCTASISRAPTNRPSGTTSSSSRTPA